MQIRGCLPWFANEGSICPYAKLAPIVQNTCLTSVSTVELLRENRHGRYGIFPIPSKVIRTLYYFYRIPL